MIGRTNFTIQIITGERLPSWSPSLITKIILLIFTTVNDSPNVAHRLLMAFSDLEKRKHKNFLKKNAGWNAIPHTFKNMFWTFSSSNHKKEQESSDLGPKLDVLVRKKRKGKCLPAKKKNH